MTSEGYDSEMSGRCLIDDACTLTLDGQTPPCKRGMQLPNLPFAEELCYRALAVQSLRLKTPTQQLDAAWSMLERSFATADPGQSEADLRQANVYLESVLERHEPFVTYFRARLLHASMPLFSGRIRRGMPDKSERAVARTRLGKVLEFAGNSYRYNRDGDAKHALHLAAIGNIGNRGREITFLGSTREARNAQDARLNHDYYQVARHQKVPISVQAAHRSGEHDNTSIVVFNYGNFIGWAIARALDRTSEFELADLHGHSVVRLLIQEARGVNMTSEQMFLLDALTEGFRSRNRFHHMQVGEIDS